MKIKSLILTTVSFAFLNHSMYAQTDSGYIDLGRIKLNKEFAQTTTIKGEDLERMPFSSLHEAINVYLYGGYSNQNSLVYIIDGNLINDVNAYSVYDIESVILFQNALKQLNGALTNKQLVLITTRNNRKKGITLAGSSYIVNRRNAGSTKNIDAASGTDLYHQYYLSAHLQKGKTSFGASAGFLREVSPYEKYATLVSATPYHFNRIRLNGWFNAAMGQKTTLAVRINAVPQRSSMEDEFTVFPSGKTNADLTSKEFFINPSLSLFTRLSKEWSNELSASFVSSSLNAEKNSATLSSSPASNFTNYHIKQKTLIVKDDIRYSRQLEKWKLEPAANIMFRSIKYENTINKISYSGNNNPGSFPNSSATSSTSQSASGNVLIFTPSLTIYHKNYLSLQGGIQMNTNPFNIVKKQDIKTYPFASATIDLIKMINDKSSDGFKLYGSYGKPAYWLEEIQQLTDLSFGGNNVSAYDLQNYTRIYNTPDGSDRAWMVGTGLQFLNNHLQIDYNYEDVSYAVIFLNPVLPPVFTPGPGFPPTINNKAIMRTSMHRISIQAQVIESTAFTWRTSATISGM